MASKTQASTGKKIFKTTTTIIAVLIGLFIIMMLFFKFAPGYGFYIVRTGSMVPAINPGDIVFTGPADKIAPGTIITFDVSGETVTHRIVSISGDQILTKGDANKTADASPINKSAIKGTYLFRVPAIGYVTSLTGTKKGWFLLVILPSILLVMYLVKDKEKKMTSFA